MRLNEGVQRTGLGQRAMQQRLEVIIVELDGGVAFVQKGFDRAGIAAGAPPFINALERELARLAPRAFGGGGAGQPFA